MPLRRRLTERFGIEHPIVSAPMGFVAGGKLAAATSLFVARTCLSRSLAASAPRACAAKPPAKSGDREYQRQHRWDVDDRNISLASVTNASGERGAPDAVHHCDQRQRHSSDYATEAAGRGRERQRQRDQDEKESDPNLVGTMRHEEQNESHCREGDADPMHDRGALRAKPSCLRSDQVHVTAASQRHQPARDTVRY
jgi:hypothetical protein